MGDRGGSASYPLPAPGGVAVRLSTTPGSGDQVLVESRMPDDQTRVLLFTARGPSWAARAAVIAWVVFVLALAALVIVPILIVGAAALLAGTAWIALRRLAARARGDGRRNVRVVDRQN